MSMKWHLYFVTISANSEPNLNPELTFFAEDSVQAHIKTEHYLELFCGGVLTNFLKSGQKEIRIRTHWTPQDVTNCSTCWVKLYNKEEHLRTIAFGLLSSISGLIDAEERGAPMTLKEQLKNMC